MFWLKKTAVPVAIETIEIETVQLWEVEWQSRHGGYSGDTRREFEVFTSEFEAERFKAALEAAFRLIRHTHGAQILMRKRA
jgi:hypothetical protein